MKPLKLFLYTLIPALALISGACSTNMEEIRAITEEEELPMLTVQGLKTVYTTNARPEMQLTTSLLYRYADDKKAYFEFPKGCRINFYDAQAQVHSSLKADSAIYHEKTQNAKASGNVVLTNTNGSILRTQELYLNGKEQKIYSVKPVTITYADGSVIQGDKGFESNTSFTVYRFTDVTGLQKVADEF